MQSEAPADVVRAELTRVLSSSVLAASPRRAGLLRFLVEQTLDGHGDGLKESVIAAEIYGDPNYDPKRQAIVRSEIRRLRLSLLEYYTNCDAPSPIRIEIPKGKYRPHFVPTAAPASVVLSTAHRPRWAILAPAAVGLAVLALAWAGLTRMQPQSPGPAKAESALVRRGHYFLQLRTAASLNQALACFGQAVRDNGSDARAWSGLAETLAVRLARGQVAPAISALRSTDAAHRAIERDASLSEPHLALATIRTYYEWDWPGAESEYLEAIRLDPMDADSHRGYAMHLLIQKRLDQSRSQVKLAQRLDPVSYAVNEAVEMVDLYSGRLDEAEADVMNLKELYPNSDVSGMMRIIYLEKFVQGDTQARTPFTRISTLLAQAPTVDGKLNKAHLAIFNRQWPDAKRDYEDIVHLSKSVYIPPTAIGMLKGAAFGYKGELFAAAYKEHDPALVWCRYLGVTAGSDLPEVIRKMGLQ